MTLTSSDDMVLVVERNPDDVFLAERALRKAGLASRVCALDNCREALAYLAGEGMYSNRAAYPLPRLIILHLNAPQYPVRDFLSWLRQKPDLRSIPVVVTSGQQERLEEEIVSKYGADFFLLKQVHLVDFAEVLRVLV